MRGRVAWAWGVECGAPTPGLKTGSCSRVKAPEDVCKSHIDRIVGHQEINGGNICALALLGTRLLRRGLTPWLELVVGAFFFACLGMKRRFTSFSGVTR